MARFDLFEQYLRPNSREGCLNNTTVATKVIRYPMYEDLGLKKVIPDLKVIHYVRGARGILASRARLCHWLDDDGVVLLLKVTLLRI